MQNHTNGDLNANGNNGEQSNGQSNGQNHGNGAPNDGSLWLRVAPDALFASETAPDGQSRVLAPLPPQGMAPGVAQGGFYATYAAGYADAQETLDLRNWIGRLYRHRLAILLVWAGVIVATFIYSKLSAPVFESGITLLMKPRATGNVAADLPFIGGMVDTQSRSVKTQTDLLLRPELRREAIASLKPELRPKAEDVIDVRVQSGLDSDLVDVRVAARQPRNAQALANALGMRFLELNQKRNRYELHQAGNYVEGKLKEMRGKLDAAQMTLLNYKQHNQTVDPEIEGRAQIARLDQIEADWRGARAEKQAQAARLARLQQLAGQTPPSSLVPQAVVRNPAVETMKSELTRLQLEKAATAQEYRPTSEKMRALDARIASIRRDLTTQAQTEVGSWQTNPVATALQQEIAEVQASIWDQEARGVALKKQSKEVRAILSTVPRKQYQLGQLTTDLETLHQTYDLLNEKYQQLRISEQAEVSNAQIISWADLPDSPVSPRLSRNLVIGLISGLLLGLALAALLDTLDNHVHSAEDAELASGRPVLARVPQMGASVTHSLLSNPYAPSPLLETYRMLRTNIEFSAIDIPIRSLAITSSQPNEGKTTSAVNLAIAMALDGKQVIVVDCDLRRPSLHRAFGISNAQGFTGVLAGNQSLENALQETSIPGLRVLASGPIPPNPTEILNSRAGRNLIARIAEGADLVILDCPPGLVMADAQIVASTADATILVVSAREAGRREVTQTAAQLNRTGARILGVLLNKVEEKTINYKYYGDYLAAPIDTNPEINGAADKELAKTKNS